MDEERHINGVLGVAVIKWNVAMGCTRWLLQLVFVAGVVAGCGETIPSSDSATTTTVTLQGQLTDAATGEPIVGAKIDIGSRSAVTDINGHYEIGNVPVNAGNGVARDYQATITLTGVTAPIDMTDTSTTPRYPDRKFTKPVSVDDSIASANHDFKVGKLSATIQGVVGGGDRLPLGGATVELRDNTPGTVGDLVRSTTSDPATGQYAFANIEAGVDYNLVGRSSDGLLQGSVTTGELDDDQTLQLYLGGGSALVLSSTDTYSPRIIAVSPENNSDIAPGAVDVVLTFNEAIKQDSYSIPNPLATESNIFHDIEVSYGGQKAAGNLAHSMSWNATFDALTISIPYTGVSSKYTVDLSLLSPTTVDSTTTLGKLKDNAGNGLENSPVLTDGHLLSFTTNGGVLAAAPVILSPNAAGLDSDAMSVMLDWQPVSGATNGYNIYRSTRNDLTTGVVEPFVFLAGPVAESSYTDTFSASGFSLLATSETAQYYVYRVTSLNSDLIESAPSNEATVRDVISPSPDGTAGICVSPGGDSLTVTEPVMQTANGQVQFTFSEPLDVVAAETISNYTGTNISGAKLTTPTTVVLDFSSPINCVNTETVIIGTGVTDVAGNPMSGTLAERTLTYVP